jgi:selenide,water dikinase
MTPEFPFLRDIVLIGGGHAHALLLRMWAMDPLAGARLTLITPDAVTPYTGMLPGLVAGHYRRDELMIDLVRLARLAGARLILDRATGLEPERRLIHLAGRPPLAYDVASIDIGITSDVPELSGAGHAVAAKPLAAFASAWEAFVARRLPDPRVVILGAGLGGVELAMAAVHRLGQQGSAPRVTLIDRADSLLSGLGRSARQRILARMARDGIKLRTGTEVVGLGPASVRLRSGEEVGSDFTLTVTGARPHGWLAETGLDHDRGFLVTDNMLRTSSPLVFAAGDCAAIRDVPRPKAGVFAVRAAPVLFSNLRAALSDRPMRAFRPQRDYLKLVALGGRSAVADKWGLSAEGSGLWNVKDRIDRQFMEKLSDLPAMARPSPPAQATAGLAEHLGRRPLCAGCGAKLGPGTLSEALADLPEPMRPDVLSGRGDDAAILAAPAGVQVISTDHLRAFCADPRLAARLTALHALGDVWAMGATPQVALAQVTLPPLGADLQKRMLSEIMAEAAATFRSFGADVVGGHSTEGAELTIGFTVTGTALRAIGKGGAGPGDALILTKPLGSGTILAAEMAVARLPGMLLGEIWAGCIGQMSRAQGNAAAILAPVATAMTDVTGFGLAGHLLEMLEASSAAATVRIDDIPMMTGAVELAAAGYGSSLQPANLAATSWKITAPEDPRIHLLNDPQTCGGLLAAVPAALAGQLVAALRIAGHDAAVIGEVTAGLPHLFLR